MVQTALEKESKEESLFMEDLCSKLREARVFAQDTLEKLRCFCEKSGRRKISELNEILDSTELNDFIRLVFNEDHPTLDSKDQIRKLDYEIERCTLSGEKQIRASEKKGLSFCRSLEKLVVSSKSSIKLTDQKELNKMFMFTLSMKTPRYPMDYHLLKIQ